MTKPPGSHFCSQQNAVVKDKRSQCPESPSLPVASPGYPETENTQPKGFLSHVPPNALPLLLQTAYLAIISLLLQLTALCGSMRPGAREGGAGSSSWWWSIKPQNDHIQAIVPLQGSQHLTLIFNCRKYNSQTKTHIPDKAGQLIFQTSLMQIWAKGFKFVQSDFYRCLTITQLLQLLEAFMFLKEQTPHSLGFFFKKYQSRF